MEEINPPKKSSTAPLLIGIAALVMLLGCMVMGVAALGVYLFTAQTTPAFLAPFVVDVNEPLPEQTFTDTASPFTEAIIDPEGAAGFAVGDPDAPVTVVEYGDFSCPYCYQFARETDSLLVEAMQEGDVRYVFKPLTFVNPPTSTAAADTAYCAAQQGVFWLMHEQLWIIFEDVGASGYADEERVLAAAEGIDGVDEAAFSACLAAGMPQTLLDNVAAEAESLDVSGTPTVFVNGERVRFSEGYAENLLEAIQTALGGPEI